MNKALMDAIISSDAQRAFDQVMSESSSVVRWFNDFAQGIVFAILDKNFDATVLRDRLEPLDIGPVPSSACKSTPFFFEVPAYSPSSEPDV
jgi:hypothetical protein